MPRPCVRFWPNSQFLQSLNYPHMERREREMFRLWLRGEGTAFMGFMFDVRVGPGRSGDPRASDNIRKMWSDLTKKRIDAVGFKGLETWLIEVKHTLNMMTLGQIDTYSALYMDEYWPEGPFVRAAIVQHIDPDVLPLARAREIRIFEIPFIRIR